MVLMCKGAVRICNSQTGPGLMLCQSLCFVGYNTALTANQGEQERALTFLWPLGKDLQKKKCAEKNSPENYFHSIMAGECAIEVCNRSV